MPLLHCEIGDHDYFREPQRGRPPKNCPEHRPSEPTVRLSPTHSVPKVPSAKTHEYNFSPKLSAAIEAAEREQRMVTLHCIAGDHDWEWERKRGRRPHSCPEHALNGIKMRKEELTIEQKKKAQERLQEAIARHSARVNAASVPEKEAMQRLIAAGGTTKADDRIFNDWLRANNILLNEVLSLRAKERKLDALSK